MESEMNPINYFKLAACLCVLVALLMNSGASTSASAACGGWGVVSSPNGGPNNHLYGVAAVSTTNAWAVGGYQSSNGNNQTLIEHWNGTQWSVVPSPSPGSDSNELWGVSADSSSDVWAVGDYSNGNFREATLIEHWNGNQWSIVKSPDASQYDNYLLAVTALSPTNVWAVGYSQANNAGPINTLVEQWNGSQWSVVSGPHPGTFYNFLYDVTAVSA